MFSATQKIASVIAVAGIVLSFYTSDPLYYTSMLLPVAGMIGNREYQRRKKLEQEKA